MEDNFPGALLKGIKEPQGWIEQRSRGHLKIPNLNLIKICRELDNQLEDFQGSGINMEPNPISKLLDKCLEGRSADQIITYICKTFVSVRFFNCIKLLNLKVKAAESAEKIRRLQQLSQHLYWINLFHAFLTYLIHMFFKYVSIFVTNVCIIVVFWSCILVFES